MLRTALLASILALGASAASAATIVMNGDFETVDGRLGMTDFGSGGDALNSLAGSSGKNSWDVYSDLPGGWVNGNGRNSGTGIEVQTQNTIGGVTPHSGNHYIELDSEGPSNGNTVSNSRLAQNIFLSAGTYDLSFWYRARPNTDASSNGILSRLITLPSPTMSILPDQIVTEATATGSSEDWVEIIRRFTVTEDTDARLVFFARGTEDELGGFIDTVSISAVPLPAGMLLMLSGLAGFGALRRRQRG